MGLKMRILDGTESDLPAIVAIFNDAVVNTTAIWSDVLATVEARKTWMEQRRAGGFPVFVAKNEADEVVGFASYGPYRPFDGFRLTVEHSVYVRPDQRGKGVGGKLLDALITHARGAGLHVMVGGITADNAASIALHERRGFAQVGLLPQVGVKFGRWLDLAFLQLKLDDLPHPNVD
ncbi:GNAT family N-acetyltransferase [Ketogulonicigenium vulgare]|uniref:GNAT family N-acetyltransferase n=1 Tax=Ketogulonicigenium vulgare TaxID=92945 RepID=UPI003B58BDDD